MNFLLIQIPKFDLVYPPLALAYLKSSLEQHNHVVDILDLNIRLYDQKELDYNSLDHYFQFNVGLLNTLNNFDLLIPEWQKSKQKIQKLQEYENFLERSVDNIDWHKYDHVGISVFSMNSIMFLLDFLYAIKNKNIRTSIVLGGMGLQSFDKFNLAEQLIENKLCRKIILGEGEQSLPQINNLADITTSFQIDNLDNISYPDYDKFELNHYRGYKRVNVTGSRGCVRNCSFCDVNYLWPKYRYRNGKNIAEEIKYLHIRYGFENFDFTDSLINGNLKNFREFLDCIIDYKSKNILPDHITFSGQFICRPQNQFVEKDYEKMKSAGVYKLSVGVESGSESVLKHMGKNIKESDHDFMFEMLDRYEIRSNILLIVGYVTETREDFQKTLDMLTRYKIYSDRGTIASVSLGKTLVILPNTPLWFHKERMGIEIPDRRNWISLNNPDLNIRERYRRRLSLEQHCRSLGYVISQAKYNMIALKQIIDNGFEEIKLS